MFGNKQLQLQISQKDSEITELKKENQSLSKPFKFVLA